MESVGGEHQGDTVGMRKVAGASFVGAFLEWYDFNLFAISAGLVLNQLFFPNVSPVVGTLSAFATFAVGFIARPFGGLIFGHFGDRVGRKAMLVATMLLIGGATFLMGLLPTYSAIGILAPILLVTLRFVQGLGLGGEFGGAALMVIEHSPRRERGFWGSLPQLGGPAGFLVGTGLFGLLGAILSQEQFLSWGWRIPFLFSVLLLVVGFIVRLKILETPTFRRVKETASFSRIPVWDLLKTYPKNLALAWGARVGEAATSQLFLVFSIAYITTQLGLSNNVTLIGIAIYNAIALLIMPAVGALSDRVGRRPLYMAGATLLGLYLFPYFWLLNTEVPALIWLALGLATFPGSMMGSLQMTFFTELFGPRVRYSGLSVAYQASAVVAGFTPAILTSLLIATGGTWAIALAGIGIAIVTVTSTYLLTETFSGDIHEMEERLAQTEVTESHNSHTEEAIRGTGESQVDRP